MLRGDSRLVVILTSALFFLLVLLVQNGSSFFDAFTLTSLPPLRRFMLALSTLFDLTSTFTVDALIIALVGSLLSGLNIALLYVYMKVRGTAVLRSGLYSGLGLILALLGVGCVACGAALLSAVLSFLGFSTVLAVLPYHGVEIGYLGLIVLLIATYTLSKKATAPLVC